MGRKAMREEEYRLEVPVPTPGREMPTEIADERENLAKITKETPRDMEAEDAFLASKSHIARTHPALDRAERELAVGELTERLGSALLNALTKDKTPPVPGGVGYGVFFNSTFKSAFAGGTSVYFEIVCPTPPGGNVNTWLYLTGMNRAGRGIEAFVSYYAQNEAHFKVFDWARTDHWQIDVPFGSLGSYLGTASAHGSSYQTLGVWNSTFQISSTQWRNEAWLWNRAGGRWDLIYRYDYNGTQTEQTAGWIGSWGPIVETFQSPYLNTNRFGAINTMLISRGSSGAWGSWQLLSAANSYIRTDNQGFFLVFLDPNYAFVVDS
jgi:hypothetical protein